MTSTTLTTHGTSARDLAKSGATLSDVLDAIAVENSLPLPKLETRKIPKTVTVDVKQRGILRGIVARLSAFAFPDSVRVLTEAEKAEFIDLFRDIKTAKSVIVKAEEALRDLAHNHLDAALTDTTGLRYDKAGHFVADGEIVASGLTDKVVRGTRGGGAEPLTLTDLEKLEADDRITHQEFLALTKPSRVVDQAAIMARIAKDDTFVAALKNVIRLTDKTTAINIRKSTIET